MAPLYHSKIRSRESSFGFHAPTIMTTYWDFRKILDVHPESDIQCIAITKGGQRCRINGGWMNSRNLTEAAGLLNTMDRTKSLRECCGHLDNLAYLTVCGSPHRNMKDVQKDCCRSWIDRISLHIASGAENESKKAHAVKSKKTLDMRSTEVISTELSDGEGAQVV